MSSTGVRTIGIYVGGALLIWIASPMALRAASCGIDYATRLQNGLEGGGWWQTVGQESFQNVKMQWTDVGFDTSYGSCDADSSWYAHATSVSQQPLSVRAKLNYMDENEQPQSTYSGTMTVGGGS